MGFQLFQVDAFTRQRFAGNPAAVCLLPHPQPDGWMQQLAQEMNLSETAFILPQSDGFQLRWLTPTVEVDLCGHATLATAHVLWEQGILTPDQPARFHTRSGILTATRQGDWIELDFPATRSQPIDYPPGLLEALGISSSVVHYVGKNQFDYLVAVESDSIVRDLTPTMARLKSIPVRGVVVTSQATNPESSEYDMVSRFFAPGSGIDEDPVTGSAHCALAPFWGDRLGKTTLIGYQASARGGVVKMQCLGDRVLLAGQAVTVFQGALCE